MQLQHPLWHTFGNFGTDQLSDGKKIVTACAGVIPPGFQRLTHRTGSITIPCDNRIATHAKKSTSQYPQVWHSDWMKWTKGILLVPTGAGLIRFGIGIYVPSKKELKICSEMRRINQGSFARKLTNQTEWIFLLAEMPMSFHATGIRGGTEEGANPFPEKIDLY